MDIEVLRLELQARLQAAQQSRNAGREGRARVQVRILAGCAVEAFALADPANTYPQRSAFEWLQWLSAHDEFPDEITGAAKRLTVRVTPSFDLPHQEDPLQDGWLIADEMLRRMSKL